MSFKTIFIIFIVLIVLVLAASIIYLWYESSAGKGLNVKLSIPSEIRVGIPFILEAGVSNDSKNVLKDVELLVELPLDMAFSGSAPDKILHSKKLGTLGSDSLTRESIELIALGGLNTVREIKVKVSYLPDVLGSRFEKVEALSFSILESSINFDISAPQKVFSGEEFEIKVAYKNVSDREFSDFKINLNYPPAFVFKSASPKPESGNASWLLPALKNGQKGELIIKGQLNGADGAFFEMGSELMIGSSGRSYVISKKSASIAIAASPLSLSIEAGGISGSIARPGDELNFRLNFRNNTDVGLRDAIVKAKLVGEMFDLSTIRANASFRAADNSLIWNTSNNPALSVLEPGSISFVEFSIKVKADYSLRRLGDKNFTLKIAAEIESPTVPPFVASAKTQSFSELETKVGGRLTVDAQGFFRDADSGILNRGFWPPRVGQATNLTIHWLPRNFATDIKNIKIKAFLGNNVKLTKEIKSNTISKPSYNDRTQEVIWEIDRMPAGKGVVNAPLEAIFQVELTPAANQIGSTPVLIQTTSYEAEDEFTGERLSGSDTEVTTDRLDDKTVKSEEGRVTQ